MSMNRTSSRRIVQKKQTLIIRKSIFNISIMKSFVVDKLLSVQGDRYNDRSWNSSIWRCNIHYSVIKPGWFGLNCSISYCDITNTFLSETFTKKS